MPTRRTSAGTRSSWSCAATIACSPEPASRTGRRPRARSSGRSSTWSSSSSRAARSHRFWISTTSWHASRTTTWTCTCTPPPRSAPIDRFQAEIPHLTPLPEQRFVGTLALSRKVSWDCLVSFRGSRYSVPAVYAGKLVWLLVSRGTHLLVLDAQRADLAEHALSQRHGTTVLIQEHYATLRRGRRARRSCWPNSSWRAFHASARSWRGWSPSTS